MTWQHRNRRDGRAFTGLIFLIIGVVLLLSNLNVLSMRQFLSQWWPLILVIVGIKQLVLCGSKGWIGALFWVGTGALFLASTLGYIQIQITSIIWPVMLIWFGVVIALGHNGRCGRGSIDNVSGT